MSKSKGRAMADLKLGPNEQCRSAIEFAAQRTGLDPAALAALIDAEAAKLPSGVWDANSAAQSSSAVGLTQFLAATWREMALRPTTLLHEEATAQDYIDPETNAIQDDSALLELRRDPRLSITTAAEYARANLDYLSANGIDAADEDDEARLAYLAHHEGPQGARRFIEGTIGEAHAQHLLATNVGSSKADTLRAAATSWETAYKTWLDGYISAKIQPSRFRA
jgi:hypothetical protein